MPGTTLQVLLTQGAEQDLEAIFDHIAAVDSPAKAEHVLERLMKEADKLAHFPERGAYPRELIGLGIRDFRQTVFKPYRVIYRVLGSKVFIHVIADGRRDVQALLARRLLAS